MSTSELASCYAALILADDDVEITAEKLQTLIAAAKVESEPIMSTLLAKALAGKDVKDMLSNVGSGGGGPAAAPAVGGAAAPAAGGDAPAAEAAKEEAAKEESDDDMGFGLFD